jgi:Mrp family chromosome partitioning ATPase
MLDCDMYLSKLNKTKGFSLAPIKADQGTTAREPEPQRWPGEEFWIIPAGEFSTIGGHLDERSFAVVLEKLRREFDYIVLDSPPLPVASDGLALGRFADLILSVVSLRNTERRSFEVHNELIAGLGRQHGLIINGVEGSSYTEADGYFLGMVKKRKRFSGWFGIKLA